MRYPLRRLRRKKMAVAKPMIPMIASVRGRLGNGGEGSDAEAEEFVSGARSSLPATGEGVGSDGFLKIS